MLAHTCSRPAIMIIYSTSRALFITEIISKRLKQEQESNKTNKESNKTARLYDRVGLGYNFRQELNVLLFQGSNRWSDSREGTTWPEQREEVVNAVQPPTSHFFTGTQGVILQYLETHIPPLVLASHASFLIDSHSLIILLSPP